MNDPTIMEIVFTDLKQGKEFHIKMTECVSSQHVDSWFDGVAGEDTKNGNAGFYLKPDFKYTPGIYGLRDKTAYYVKVVNSHPLAHVIEPGLYKKRDFINKVIHFEKISPLEACTLIGDDE